MKSAKSADTPPRRMIPAEDLCYSAPMKILEENPTLEEFKHLRTLVDWPLPPDSAIEKALEHTEYSIVLRQESKILGMGRIVSDFGFIYFIADIIVDPDFQGKGYGRIIMDKIMEYLKENAPENSYITLMAAKGKESFYEKFGFFNRPTENYGSGMMVVLEK